MEPAIGQPAFTPPPIGMYAGFWRRFLAYIIDKLLLGVVAMIILIPFFLMMGMGAALGQYEEYYEDPPIEFVIAFLGAYSFAVLLIVVIEWLYFALMESKNGATLGKMAIGIYVTDMEGRRISFARATGRHFGKILSGLILCIGYVMAGFTQQKQALHDILAGCLVINKR